MQFQFLRTRGMGRASLVTAILEWLLQAAAALLGVTLLALHATTTYLSPWIGHGDPADFAVVARNVAEGHGFTVNYIWQFFRDYPSVTHPEDVWPLLEPLMMAFFFRVIGVSPFAAKIPNLIILGLASVTIWWIGRRLLGRHLALVPPILLLADPRLNKVVLYPYNDLGAGLFLTWSLCFAVRAHTDSSRRLAWAILAGAAGGLAFLQKPNVGGFCLLVVFASLVLQQGWAQVKTADAARPTRRGLILGRWRTPFLFAAAWVVVAAPYLCRNLLLFGNPLYTLNTFNTLVQRYGPYEDIYRIYFDNTPSISSLLQLGAARIIGAILMDAHRMLRDLVNGTLFPALMVLPALLGSIPGSGVKGARG